MAHKRIFAIRTMSSEQVDIKTFLDETVKSVMHEFDEDNSGFLDRVEAQRFVDQISLALQSQGHDAQSADFDDTFDAFDSNEDGRLSHKELKEFIHLLFVGLNN